MNTQLNEIIRLIIKLIRTGTVTEVERENWPCRVKVGEMETHSISWLSLCTGGARTIQGVTQSNALPVFYR